MLSWSVAVAVAVAVGVAVAVTVLVGAAVKFVVAAVIAAAAPMLDLVGCLASLAQISCAMPFLGSSAPTLLSLVARRGASREPWRPGRLAPARGRLGEIISIMINYTNENS